MQMVGSADRYVIARESNVVLVDFRRPDMPGKRVQFDDENWQALYLLARDQERGPQGMHPQIRIAWLGTFSPYFKLD